MDRFIPITNNEWYHVYNRGNDRRQLFHDGADYRAFLDTMSSALVRYRVERLAYVLMPNHFHFILKQQPEGSLPRMMDALGTSYAKRFNLRHSHSGHVFEGRYRYAHIPSDEALLNVVRYVHLNPVRAQLVGRPEDWKYSDFKRVHLHGVLQQELDRGRGGIDYAAFVQQGVDDIEAVRRFLFELPRRPSAEIDPGRRTP
jgi:REP element-mobilizing transposase RayT